MLRISLVSIISIMILSAIVYTQIDRALESLRGQTVQEQAKSIVDYLETNRGKNKILLDLPDSFRRFYARAGDAYQYLVRDEEENRLFTSPIAFADYFPDDFDAVGDGKFDFTGPSGRKFVGFTLPAEIEGKNSIFRWLKPLLPPMRFRMKSPVFF